MIYIYDIYIYILYMIYIYYIYYIYNYIIYYVSFTKAMHPYSRPYSCLKLFKDGKRKINVKVLTASDNEYQQT